jgi:hypothetical protein
MLIDELMPDPDGTRVDHRVIDAPPQRVYEAALRADFARAFDENRIARGLTSLRCRIERAVALARRRPRDAAPAEEMTLGGLSSHGQYVLLGADPPREIAFGMIGRFWGGETVWLEIDSAEFRSFDRPGFARIACNLSLREYGEGRTLVSYETRTKATDAFARRSFLRYWRMAGPLAGIVLRAQLADIAGEVERSAVNASSPHRAKPRAATTQ